MAIDLTKLIDDRPVGAFQAQILGLTALAVILDGFSIQAGAFAAPSLLREWELEAGALGPILGAVLIGMTLGTFLGGVAGDRWGRRSTLIASTLCFGAMSLATAAVTTPLQLTALRFLTGLALGAVMPNATALVAEWMPQRRRSLAITTVAVGVPAGGMIGAAISAWLIPTFGWRACFIVSGMLPLVLGAYMFTALPESIRFLALRRPAALPALIGRIAPGTARDATFDIGEEPAPHARTGRLLLVAPYRRSTLGLWLAFFTNMAAVYALINWIPTLLTSLGYPIAAAIRGAFIFNLFGVLGAFAGGWYVARVGSHRALLLLSVAALAGIAAMTAALWAPGAGTWRAMAALAAAGVSVLGLQVGLFGLAAAVYPTSCRSTGVGWAAGFGRIGSIASAFGSAAIFAGEGHGSFFAALAMVLALTAIGTRVVDRHSPAVART